MTADTITAIKKALEGVTPDRVERLWWFLHILSKSSGTTNAEDDKWNWINAFCTDYEDDTFNRASQLGFIRVSHNSIMETSTASMTYSGNVFIDYFDKPPSATVNAALESLQRENEELRKALDGREPDYCFDPKNWEFTSDWSDCNQVHGYGEGLKIGEPMEVATLIRGPRKWVADVPISWDEDGDADETEIQWFDSEEAARAALASTGGEHHAE